MFMDDRIFKKLPLSKFDQELLKIHDIFCLNSRNFCSVFVLQYTQREHVHKIEDSLVN